MCMVSIVSLYRQLFGGKGPLNGNVIDMAEHGRIGGVSTGDGYKRVASSEKFLNQEGFSYIHSDRVTLGNGATRDILLITPAGTDVHFAATIRSTGEAFYELFEGTTVSANGSALNTYNRNRRSSNTTGVLLYAGPTISNDGTLIKEIGFGSGNKEAGRFEATDIILKREHNYLLRITSNAVDNAVSYILDWNEEG